jgi:hypothetical protein
MTAATAEAPSGEQPRRTTSRHRAAQEAAETKADKAAQTSPEPRPAAPATSRPAGRRRVAKRLLALREKGVARAALGQVLGLDLTPAKVWRIERGRVHPTEVTPRVEAVDRVAERGLPAELTQHTVKTKRPTRADLEAKLAELGWTWQDGE